MKSVLAKTPGKAIRSKRRLVLAAALLATWTMIAVYWQTEEIWKLAGQNAAAAAHQLIWLTRIAAVGMGILVVALGAWTWRVGQMACRAEQFPVIEAQVLRRPRTIEGRKARTLGRISQVAGLLFLLLGTASAWLLVELAELTLVK
ncbi:MAG: hypothetical protein GX621_11860 [Pirellulaceae bacterium]|nr:hypothetical protein [Pirellulaceae bacterium]